MYRLALLLGVLVLSVGLAATAGATQPATAGGTILADDLQIDWSPRGPNLFTHITSTGTITGTLSGAQVSTYEEVVNPTGNSTLQGTLVCDPCTVDGRSGTVVFRQVGTIVGDPFSLELRTIAVSATDELAGLHANLVVRWNGVGAATYSGSYHFGP